MHCILAPQLRITLSTVRGTELIIGITTNSVPPTDTIYCELHVLRPHVVVCTRGWIDFVSRVNVYPNIFATIVP